MLICAGLLRWKHIFYSIRIPSLAAICLLNIAVSLGADLARAVWFVATLLIGGLVHIACVVYARAQRERGVSRGGSKEGEVHGEVAAQHEVRGPLFSAVPVSSEET